MAGAEFKPTALPDVVRITPEVFSDNRGTFCEVWNARRFKANGLTVDFVQDNACFSRCGVLRGLHYQVSQAQGKLVRVVQGEIFDVAVDVRKNSPTLGTWVAETLSADNGAALWIPPGFAHGYFVQSDCAVVTYKCTNFYAPEFERAIRWDDPELAIEWPIPEGSAPIVSDRDSSALRFVDAETVT